MKIGNENSSDGVPVEFTLTAQIKPKEESPHRLIRILLPRRNLGISSASVSKCISPSSGGGAVPPPTGRDSTLNYPTTKDC